MKLIVKHFNYSILKFLVVLKFYLTSRQGEKRKNVLVTNLEFLKNLG